MVKCVTLNCILLQPQQRAESASLRMVLIGNVILLLSSLSCIATMATTMNAGAVVPAPDCDPPRIVVDVWNDPL
jgi:hypothetical protein